MAFIDDFADMLGDTLTHAALSTRDAYGKPTYATGTSYSCRLVRQHKLVRSVEGQEIVSTSHAWIGGTPSISPQDKITLSDSTVPVIAAIERQQDESGAAFTKVFFL